MSDNKNYYALQAVIFKKPIWNLEKASDEIDKYIHDKKKHFYRETKQSYRFRNIPKQKFIKKTFKTKKLDNGVSLIMGQLKDEHSHLEGAGIFDLFKKPIQKVKEFFTPRQGYNNTTTRNLNSWGNLIIQDLTIARTPILDILDKVINVISLGKWSKLKKENSYDKLFHLQLIANLGQESLVIEKNEVINVDTKYKITKETELLKIDLQGKKFSTNQMLNETQQRVGDKLYFSYEGFTNNCQVFVKECLVSEGLYGKKEEDFLFQDMTEIIKKFPSLSRKIMHGTTHIGAVFNKITGKGEDNLPKKRGRKPKPKIEKNIIGVINENIPVINKNKAEELEKIKKELLELHDKYKKLLEI